MFPNGAHPRIVQEILGHAQITLTLDTYCHVLPSMQEGAVGRLGELLDNGLVSGWCQKGRAYYRPLLKLHVLPAKRGILVARSAVLEPATFSVRSQDTCVYSGLRLLQNCLPKPNCRSRCLQLFTRITVKSLSTTVASKDQPAAFRCGKGSSSRKLISGTEIHWKSGFREAPYSDSR